MEWLSFEPTDTLFFRGAQPLEPGAHTSMMEVFPPASSVLRGAVATTSCKQNNLSYDKIALIDKPVLGPLLQMDSEIYCPAPATWYYEKNSMHDANAKIIKAVMNKGDDLEKLGVKSKHKIQLWVKSNHEVKSLLGAWVPLKAFNDPEPKVACKIYFNESQYLEERNGIELNGNGTVVQGKLYSAKHVRLPIGTKLVWAQESLTLNEKGILQLGGEQRFGAYQLIKSPELPKVKEDLYLACAPIPVTEDTAKVLLASGKIQYKGGWDLKKQFHKPMMGYFPAGSVFSQNVLNSCIHF